MVFGNRAGETSTSTSTGKTSIPSSEKVFSLASIYDPSGYPARGEGWVGIGQNRRPPLSHATELDNPAPALWHQNGMRARVDG
jgi:hypothetical protein